MAIQQFNTVADLRFAIEQLEIKQANEWPPLKALLLASVETLKPKHILRRTFKEMFSEPAVKTTAINTAIELTAALTANFFFPTKVVNNLAKLVTGTIVGVTTMRKVVNKWKSNQIDRE